jgi:hypothetical protein
VLHDLSGSDHAPTADAEPYSIFDGGAATTLRRALNTA